MYCTSKRQTAGKNNAACCHIWKQNIYIKIPVKYECRKNIVSASLILRDIQWTMQVNIITTQQKYVFLGIHQLICATNLMRFEMSYVTFVSISFFPTSRPAIVCIQAKHSYVAFSSYLRVESSGTCKKFYSKRYRIFFKLGTQLMFLCNRYLA